LPHIFHGSKNIHTHTPREVIGNSKESGSPKATTIKGKYKAKLEFPEGLRLQTKNENPPRLEV